MHACMNLVQYHYRSLGQLPFYSCSMQEAPLLMCLGMGAGIDYKTNTSITAVDVSAKTLTAASGDTISYEKLIVATGARVSHLCLQNKT